MITNRHLTALVLLGALLFSGCAPRARVGALQSESQSVELGKATSVRVEINLGAGDLAVTGGAQKLLEADFAYNVTRLKPEVEYANGTLVVRQPEVKGLPVLQGIADYHNEWDLRLYDGVPMDLSVDVGAGTSELQLVGLSLTGLDVNLGAGDSTIDLSGDWLSDLKITINAGAGDISVRLPKNVGARVEVDTGVGTIEASGLKQDGNVYTNAAYGRSGVTLQIAMNAGVGKINLEVEEEAAARSDYFSVTGEFSQLIRATVEEASITRFRAALVGSTDDSHSWRRVAGTPHSRCQAIHG